MPAGAPLPEQGESMARFERAAAMLGRRLAELHVVLARASADPVFRPIRCDAQACQNWARAAREQLEAAYELIASGTDWTQEQRGSIEALLALRVRALSLPQDLAGSGQGSLTTRIHGDLHLGRILVSQGDVYFIDFEGDPLRPLDQRRRHDSPLRDVASMLRSFDYAAASVLGAGGAGQDQIALERKRDIVERFRQHSGRAFLSAYQEAAVPVGHEWQGSQAARDLLRLFLIERAAYEVCAEAVHRPAWLHVPLRGLLQLLTHA